MPGLHGVSFSLVSLSGTAGDGSPSLPDSLPSPSLTLPRHTHTHPLTSLPFPSSPWHCADDLKCAGWRLEVPRLAGHFATRYVRLVGQELSSPRVSSRVRRRLFVRIQGLGIFFLGAQDGPLREMSGRFQVVIWRPPLCLLGSGLRFCEGAAVGALSPELEG